MLPACLPPTSPTACPATTPVFALTWVVSGSSPHCLLPGLSQALIFPSLQMPVRGARISCDCHTSVLLLTDLLTCYLLQETASTSIASGAAVSSP